MMPERANFKILAIVFLQVRYTRFVRGNYQNQIELRIITTRIKKRYVILYDILTSLVRSIITNMRALMNIGCCSITHCKGMLFIRNSIAEQPPLFANHARS